MKYELSILIPIFKDDCSEMVRALLHQADQVSGLRYEIIVADDGTPGPLPASIQSRLSSLHNVRFIRREQNVGRAAIRNFLCHEAQYEWVLFLDGDMTIIDSRFVIRYLEADVKDVAYGGYRVGQGEMSCLRYIYEKDCEPQHQAEQRRKRPFMHFHTSNFLIRRNIMLAYQLDERFRHYGYEDVLWGKQLRNAGFEIAHPDNPVGFCTYEENALFVGKTEEGLRTLHTFSNELRGYSQMLTFTDGIHIEAVKQVIRLWHRLFGSLERKNLCGKHPSLTVFKLYKLGFYLSLTKND